MPLYALVDCNNFYASCERLFRPGLKGKPVVVLSNNDGCVIARSNEAKALGIPMGAPAFQWEHVFRKQGVAVFSSNYALYGDLSARVMTVLEDLAPRVEVYSIDEAFLDLSGVADAPGLCRKIRARVGQYTGIPVSIGLARTKTLAKLASRCAKKDPALGGVFDLAGCPDPEAILAAAEVGDVWGIGPRHAKRLLSRGVRTALDFSRLPADWVRKEMTVVGLQTQMELKGISCLPVSSAPAPRRSVLCSRSFGQLVEDKEHLREAVCAFAVRAAEKLRDAGLEAQAVQVFTLTPRHREELPQHQGQATVTLPGPTNFTPDIVAATLRGLDEAFRQGFAYQKAGVLLLGLTPASARQRSLLDLPPEERQRQRALMAVVDAVNRRHGRGALRLAISSAPDRPWHMRQHRRSPRYTTSWDELPRIGQVKG
ncbi:MAG: Y-family DNA polymerase [Humidesulfovibrio sp.]|uniref:Y-family DNA polymerase n=1 Tax=Humidesulfovibrio sp. TaxID=2910988 RepID=UPI0027349870|nr:Y-family DNA polymerase [Humidesulfovibrio sp.]MDP2846697.1 Y-family DNA polymerase [Humidesulfovibrio sp.]